MSASVKQLRLNNNATIPQIGFGTWLAKPGEVEKAVEIAVREGYRHIDCAYNYANQAEVGKALKAVIPSVVKRDDLFITSKLWNTSHRPELVEKELDETLHQLDTSYLDLYLIHWPVAFKPSKEMMPAKDGVVELDLETSLLDTWNAMLELPKTKVRAIGVSNCTIAHLQALISASGYIPVVNQVELHPLNPQDDLLEFCQRQGIHVTAYSPLGHNTQGKPKLTENPTVKEVAKRLGATEGQVLISWHAARGCSVIPKSVNEERIKSNFYQVELSPSDTRQLDEIGRTNPSRFNIPFLYDPKWDISIFDDPAEKPARHTVRIQ